MTDSPFYKILIISVSILLIGACASTNSDSSIIYFDSSRTDLEGVVSFARQQIGDKYKYGAKGPNSFDCSGLVSYCYGSEGIQISGSAAHMFSLGSPIQLEKGRPGDLIFYRKNGRIFHVSIISEVFGKQIWVVHSTSSRGVIEEDVMSSSYWKPMIYKVISLNTLKN